MNINLINSVAKAYKARGATLVTKEGAAALAGGLMTGDAPRDKETRDLELQKVEEKLNVNCKKTLHINNKILQI